MCTPSSSSAGRLALLAVAVAAAACQRSDDPPDVQAARAAVTRYNERLPTAFRTRDVSMLGDAASEAEADRVSTVIAGLTARGEVMIARLVRTRVERARLQDDGLALVDTDELWEYEHRPIAFADREAPRKARRYRMQYQVGRSGSGWRVLSARVVDEKDPSAS
jgi:hypothetical protein